MERVLGEGEGPGGGSLSWGSRAGGGCGRSRLGQAAMLQSDLSLRRLFEKRKFEDLC